MEQEKEKIKNFVECYQLINKAITGLQICYDFVNLQPVAQAIKVLIELNSKLPREYHNFIVDSLPDKMEDNYKFWIAIGTTNQWEISIKKVEYIPESAPPNKKKWYQF